MVDEFIASRTEEVPLRDGGRILVRPIIPDDKAALTAGFARLSEASRRFRFFQGKDGLTARELTYLTEIDYRDHFAWVALDPSEEPMSGVGVARYIRCPDDDRVAEAAVTVVDDYHGRGIAGILIGLLGESAAENGIERFRAEILGDNAEALNGISGIGTLLQVRSGVLSFEIHLPLARQGSSYELLRRIAAGAVVPRPLTEWETTRNVEPMGRSGP